MNQASVFGIYATRHEVENAVDELKSAGFRNTDISVLFPEDAGASPQAPCAGVISPNAAAMGSLGWLAGIGSLAMPGAGPLIAAGPILAVLSGAPNSGIAVALAGLGIPQSDARRYETLIQRGNILLSVHSDNADWIKRAQAILEDTGARDIAAGASETVGIPPRRMPPGA